MEPRDILGIVLLAIQASIIIPLAVELRRTRSSEGISTISETAWIIAGTGWSIYGFLTESNTLIASGFLATLGSAIVMSLIHKDLDAEKRKKSLLFGLIFFVVMIASTILFHSPGLGVFLSLFGLIQFFPQMATSIKSIKNKDAHGVPLVGTALRAAYTLTWAVYAAAWFMWGIAFEDVDWPLAAWGLAGFVAFSLQVIAGLVSQRETIRN